jgi:hypothetical protein
MKKLVLFLTLAFTINTHAQDNKSVTLIVSGQGKTQDEAKQNALRSAIEQAFGTFISSKTEILNDNLVKDEVVSVANGNIQSFEIISEVKITEGDYSSTLKAVVSVTKLTSFIESKGVAIEFKGSLFASNILIQELYGKNEIAAIKNLTSALTSLSNKSFDYSIDALEPYLDKVYWRIPITVNVFANTNFINIPNLLEQTVSSLSLSDADLKNYTKLNKEVFPITIATKDKEGIYYLRNRESTLLIIDYIFSLNNAITNILINNGIEKFSLQKYKDKLEVYDENFRLILQNSNIGFWPGSIFCESDINSHPTNKPNLNYKWYEKNNNPKKYPWDEDYSAGYSLYEIDYGFYSEKSHETFSRARQRYNGRYGFESFYPLKKIMLSLPNIKLGYVISFAKIKPSSLIVQFQFNDIRTIDEIKRVSKFEVIKNK